MITLVYSKRVSVRNNLLHSVLTLYFCHNTSRHYEYQSVHQSCFWHEYVHSHLQVYSIQIFLAAFLSCIHFNFSRTDIRAATKGKNGKTMVLPGFCKIEYNVGSSGANTTVAELFTLSTWKGI